MDIPDFSLTFEGYWRDKKRRGIPAESGIYCVYTCIYNGKKQTCSPQKLIYVGAAEDVRDCLDHHARREDWESHIDTGEELCYSFAPVAAEHREGYAAALVRKHKPPENTESGSILPDNGTVFVLSGATAFLSKRFSAG